MIFDHVQLIKIVVSNTSTDESINTALRELTFAVTDKNNNYDNEREVVSAIIDEKKSTFWIESMISMS